LKYLNGDIFGQWSMLGKNHLIQTPPKNHVVENPTYVNIMHLI